MFDLKNVTIGQAADTIKAVGDMAVKPKRKPRLKGKRTFIANGILGVIGAVICVPEVLNLMGPWAGVAMAVGAQINIYLRTVTTTPPGKAE